MTYLCGAAVLKKVSGRAKGGCVCFNLHRLKHIIIWIHLLMVSFSRQNWTEVTLPNTYRIKFRLVLVNREVNYYIEIQCILHYGHRTFLHRNIMNMHCAKKAIGNWLCVTQNCGLNVNFRLFLTETNWFQPILQYYQHLIFSNMFISSLKWRFIPCCLCFSCHFCNVYVNLSCRSHCKSVQI